MDELLYKWKNAINNDRVYEIKQMIDDGFDINTIGPRGNNALISCIAGERIEIVRLLFKQPNLDVNYRFNGSNALSFTMYSNNRHKREFRTLLLDHPDISVKTESYFDLLNDADIINFKKMLAVKDVTIINVDNFNIFFDTHKIYENMYHFDILIDYEWQQKIINNCRFDVLKLINDVGYIHPDIANEYIQLLNGYELGLL